MLKMGGMPTKRALATSHPVSALFGQTGIAQVLHHAFKVGLVSELPAVITADIFGSNISCQMSVRPHPTIRMAAHLFGGLAVFGDEPLLHQRHIGKPAGH